MKKFNKFFGFIIASIFITSVAFAAWPSVSARTKTWGAEVLTAADIQGQFDIIHTYINAMMNGSTGHTHTGGTNDGPKIPINTALTITSQAQGDVIYASSSSAWARLGAGTSGQFLQTLGAAANPTWASVPQAPRAHFTNLTATKASASTVTVTADDLIVYTTGNVGAIINSYSKTADITVSGAGGLDTGTEAANTIYYIWAIRKSSDATTNILLSTSSSSPTMPSGYDQKALVSCVGNDNSSNFIGFTQKGRKYNFSTWATLASGNVGTGTWVSVDVTPANMSTNAGFVAPGLSNFCYGTYVGNSDAAVTNDNSVATSTTTAPNKFWNNYGAGASNYWQLDVITSDTIYWISNGAGGILYLSGFEINKLG